MNVYLALTLLAIVAAILWATIWAAIDNLRQGDDAQAAASILMALGLAWVWLQVFNA